MQMQYNSLRYLNIVWDDLNLAVMCPCNKTSDQVKRSKNGFSSAFSPATCQECESFDCCPVATGKKACYY